MKSFLDNLYCDHVPSLHCSLYATSAGNLYGLVVCSFPLGVIVCISEPPTPLSKAVSTVETFCSMLRR